MREKKDIRQKLIAERQSLSPSSAGERSRAIMGFLFSTEAFSKAKTVLFYMPIKREVDTFDAIRGSFSSKRIALPVVDRENRRLVLSEAKADDCFRQGTYNIPEPKKIREVLAEEIDVAIIPGLAFDMSGNRIGYGKGYYDRLLRGMPAKKIGLAYSFQLLEFIPFETHDIKVDMIITENGIVECRSRSCT